MVETISCCKGGTWRQPPNREPHAMCYDDRQTLVWVWIEPRAGVLLGRYGVDPCNVPHPDDVVTWVNAENYLRAHGYIA